MSPVVVVKNTFICVDDDFDAACCSDSSPVMGRKRSHTDGDALSFTTKTFSERTDFTMLSDDSSDETNPDMFDDTNPLEAYEMPDYFGQATPSTTKSFAANACFFDGADGFDVVHRQNVCASAFDPDGVVRVIEAMHAADHRGAVELVRSLSGCVPVAARSVHASALLMEGIARLGTEDVTFIAGELLGSAVHTALNVHGSAVICRLLEYSSEHKNTVALIDEVLRGDIATLLLHKFGHAVAMSIISGGLPHQRRAVVEALRADLPRFARHRFATQVLIEALEQSNFDECCVLGTELIAKPGTILALSCHGFGVNVVRTMFNLQQFRQQVTYFLSKSARRVMKDRYGSDLMQELGFCAPQATAVVAVAFP